MSTLDFSELGDFIISVGRELCPGYDPDNASSTEYFQQCEIYSTAYDRRPELFNKLQWINNDDGMPLWVRPGVEWKPEYDLSYDDDDDED
jgi:hypothetical protein